MSKEKFYVVQVKGDLDTNKLQEIIDRSKSDYSCDGHEEFSLSEEEVDEILGDDAFCGGDLTDDLMERLESEAQKTFKFYFTGNDSSSCAKSFKEYLTSLNISEVVIEENEDQDWNENWKKHYKPIYLDKFVILPVWDSEKELDSEKEKIVINPGMGFGTGTHETTRQCMLSLLDELKEGATLKNCLDFGSGSGILGIAFQKICGGPVDFVDIDQRALDNNKNNSDLNFIDKSPPSNYFLRKDYSPTQTYDLVFANILEHVLLEEFDLIAKTVTTGKTLIVSGLLKEQKESIVSKYSEDFSLKREKNEGDWLALTFIKK